MESLHVISAYLAWICLPLGPIQPYFPYVNAAYLAWICHKHSTTHVTTPAPWINATDFFKFFATNVVTKVAQILSDREQPMFNKNCHPNTINTMVPSQLLSTINLLIIYSTGGNRKLKHLRFIRRLC